jgi:hypothetical protein
MPSDDREPRVTWTARLIPRDIPVAELEAAAKAADAAAYRRARRWLVPPADREAAMSALLDVVEAAEVCAGCRLRGLRTAHPGCRCEGCVLRRALDAWRGETADGGSDDES